MVMEELTKAEFLKGYEEGYITDIIVIEEGYITDNTVIDRRVYGKDPRGQPEGGKPFKVVYAEL